VHRKRSPPRPDEEPLGGLGCMFAIVLLAFGLALLDAARVPQGFAP
jgi:hypothetical protein